MALAHPAPHATESQTKLLCAVLQWILVELGKFLQTLRPQVLRIERRLDLWEASADLIKDRLGWLKGQSQAENLIAFTMRSGGDDALDR